MADKPFNPQEWVSAHEGFRDDVYLDSRGLPTVGVGHLITENSPYYGKQVGDKIDKAELQGQYQKDYDHHAEIAGKNFKDFDKHPQHVKDALINMTFQLGNKPKKWKNFNAALEEGLATGNYQNAAHHGADSLWFRDQTPKRARSVLDRLAYGSDYNYNRPDALADLPDYASPRMAAASTPATQLQAPPPPAVEEDPSWWDRVKSVAGFASGAMTNPEAGPSDTVPAMLTPGEAVIPASVAMDPDFQPMIEEMVNEGRERNRNAESNGIPVNHPGAVHLSDGTLDAKISKIYNEGYTAPGQAYAIAKSKGYAWGTGGSGAAGSSNYYPYGGAVNLTGMAEGGFSVAGYDVPEEVAYSIPGYGAYLNTKNALEAGIQGNWDEAGKQGALAASNFLPIPQPLQKAAYGLTLGGAAALGLRNAHRAAKGFADGEGFIQRAKDTAQGAKRGYQAYKAIDDYDTWARETPFVPAIYKWDEPTSWDTIKEYAPDALKAAEIAGRWERKAMPYIDAISEAGDTAKGWLGFADGYEYILPDPADTYLPPEPVEPDYEAMAVQAAKDISGISDVEDAKNYWDSGDYLKAAGSAALVGAGLFPAFRGARGAQKAGKAAKKLDKARKAHKAADEAFQAGAQKAVSTRNKVPLAEQRYWNIRDELLPDAQARAEHARYMRYLKKHDPEQYEYSKNVIGPLQTSDIRHYINPSTRDAVDAGYLPKGKFKDGTQEVSGYEGGTDMIPKPMGAPPKYNVDRPDHSEFNVSSENMGDGMKMDMTNAQHRQKIANDEGKQAQKMDHAMQTDAYKMQADQMKADQKMQQKMADKQLDLNMKMMEADVDSEVARRNQEALTTSMSGLGLVPPEMGEPPRGIEPEGEWIGFADGGGVPTGWDPADAQWRVDETNRRALNELNKPDTDWSKMQPLIDYNDLIQDRVNVDLYNETAGRFGRDNPLAKNLKEEAIRNMRLQRGFPVDSPTGLGFANGVPSLAEASTIPIRPDELPAPPMATEGTLDQSSIGDLASLIPESITGLGDAHVMDLTGRVDPAATAELEKRGYHRQGGRWVPGEKATEASFEPVVAPLREKVMAGGQLTPQEQNQVARYENEKAEAAAVDTEANVAEQIRVGQEDDMKKAQLAEENAQRETLGLPPVPEEVAVDQTTTPPEVNNATTNSATEGAKQAPPEEKAKWYDGIKDTFSDAFGSLINESGLAEAAIVYGTNKLLGYDDQTASQQALKWYGGKLQNEQLAATKQAERVAELEDYTYKKQIDAGITAPADKAKAIRDSQDKARSYGEKTAKEALDTYGTVSTKDKYGNTNKQRELTLTSSQAGGQYEKFLSDISRNPDGSASDFDFNAPGNTRALDNAMRAAVAHKQRTGKDVTDLTPFLWQAYLPESTETGNIFRTKDDGMVSAENVNKLTNEIKKTWNENDLASGNPGSLLANDITVLSRAYNRLPEAERAKYEGRSSKSLSGFYIFAKDQMALLK